MLEKRTKSMQIFWVVSPQSIQCAQSDTHDFNKHNMIHKNGLKTYFTNRVYNGLQLSNEEHLINHGTGGN